MLRLSGRLILQKLAYLALPQSLALISKIIALFSFARLTLWNSIRMVR